MVEKINGNRLDKEYYSEKYFQNVNIKHLDQLKFTTPQGNKCECYINRNPNTLLGSMVITNVNGIATEQFIHGMPKLHYYNDYLEEIEGTVENLRNKSVDGFAFIEIVEKIDGTNICLYKLQDPETGNVIEIVPKTRNMPILSHEFQELYDTVKNINVENYLQVNNSVHSLLFELSGYKNPHGINYSYPLRLHLLGMYTDNYELTNNYGDLYQTGINKPPVLGYIHYTSKDWSSNIFPDSYLNTENTHTNGNINFTQNTLQEILENISDEFENTNKNHKNNNNISPLTEGAILNLNINNRLLLMKLKPPSIKEEHTLSNGIPAHSIRKEIMKYFDEYGNLTAKENVENNIEDVILYIQDQLKEEYSYEYVVGEKTVRKIKRLLEKHTQTKVLKKDLLIIGENILKENPNLNIGDLMRTFSINHPDLKHYAGEMFNVFQTLNKKEESK